MDKYSELKEKFEANRDDENAVKMAAYMRNLFSFYGLSTPKRKAIYKDFLKSEKRKKIIDWDLLDRCYVDELMLSRLVDTFFSRTSWTMLLYAENHSISVA